MYVPLFQSVMDLDVAKEEEERWKSFIKFKRRVDRKTIMYSDDVLIKDVLPGQCVCLCVCLLVSVSVFVSVCAFVWV